MPELPEVEVVRRGLHEHVVGRTISRAAVRHPRAVRRHDGAPLEELLPGATVTGTGRRGKYAWLVLDDHDALLIHLGMSGQMLVVEPDAAAAIHERARLHFVDGASELSFVDQRTFGHLLVDRGGARLPSQVRHIARDPLDVEFDRDAVVAAMRRRRTDLKRALLDQSLVSGIGNIYADEALWRARLHGGAPTNELTRAEARRVLDAAREVMGEALAQGGTSFDALYVNVNGASGMPAMERNVPGCNLPLRAPRSPYFGGECLRPLSPSVPSLPAKTFVEAWPATGDGHVDLCAFRSLRPTARQFGQRRQAARGIEQDRAARMPAPEMVEHRHRARLRTLRGDVHA